MIFSAAASQASLLVTPRPKCGVLIRETPAGKVISGLLFGKRLRAEKAGNGWYKVFLPNPAGKTAGYASQRYLREVPDSEIEFEVHFVDVGTGDAILARSGDTEVIIDGGGNDRFFDYVRSRRLIRGPIELVVVTHRDSNHWKGLNPVIGIGRAPYRPVLALWRPDPDPTKECTDANPDFAGFRRAVDLAKRRGTNVLTHPAPSVQNLPFVPEIDIKVIHSGMKADSKNTSPNCSERADDSSLVLLLTIGSSRFLLTSDIAGKEPLADAESKPPVDRSEQWVSRAMSAELHMVDVVKAPSHGGSTASTSQFIEAFMPKRKTHLFAIFTADTKHNMPRPDVIRRWEESDAIVLRTDRDIRQGNDHIICQKKRNHPLNCTYAFLLTE